MSESKITETSLYLTFKIETEVFALEVGQVREVLDLSPVTKVPRTADYMRGVINVRGNVVPVVDLRRKLGIEEATATKDTRIVVMELNVEGEHTIVGALADSVHEVLELNPEQIEDSPKIGSRWRTDFIKGIGKQNDEFIIILDIDRIFSSAEMEIARAGAEDPIDSKTERRAA